MGWKNKAIKAIIQMFFTKVKNKTLTNNCLTCAFNLSSWQTSNDMGVGNQLQTINT